jgi:hypothetical protein
VDSVPDPLLLRKSGSVGNQTRTSGFVAKNSDYQTTEAVLFLQYRSVIVLFHTRVVGLVYILLVCWFVFVVVYISVITGQLFALQTVHMTMASWAAIHVMFD